MGHWSLDRGSPAMVHHGLLVLLYTALQCCSLIALHCCELAVDHSGNSSFQIEEPIHITVFLLTGNLGKNG